MVLGRKKSAPPETCILNSDKCVSGDIFCHLLESTPFQISVLAFRCLSFLHI